MLTKNLIYTAVTRAKKRVILVGQKRALFLAIHSGRKVKRNTCLAERILKYNQVFRQKALPQGATEQKLKKPVKLRWMCRICAVISYFIYGRSSKK